MWLNSNVSRGPTIRYLNCNTCGQNYGRSDDDFRYFSNPSQVREGMPCPLCGGIVLWVTKGQILRKMAPLIAILAFIIYVLVYNFVLPR